MKRDFAPMLRCRHLMFAFMGLLCAATIAILEVSAADSQSKPSGGAVPTIESAKPAADQKAEFIGASVCLQCHTDQENFHHNLHAKAWPKAKGIDFEHSCETCHGPGSLHAAAGGDKSNPDFYTIKNPFRLRPAEASAMCLQCHQGGHEMQWQGSVHETKKVTCANCHSMHNDAVNRGESPLLTKSSQAEVCYQCHAEKKSQIRKSGHMPLVEGKMGCAACHNPHGSNAEKMMVKPSVAETCFQCHQDKRGPFLWEHPPVRETCLNCHNPHGTHNEFMLVQRSPLLCQRCHIGTHHPPVAYDANTVNIQYPAAIDHGCVNCHVMIHGSNHPSGQDFVR